MREMEEMWQSDKKNAKEFFSTGLEYAMMNTIFFLLLSKIEMSLIKMIRESREEEKKKQKKPIDRVAHANVSYVIQ